VHCVLLRRISYQTPFRRCQLLSWSHKMASQHSGSGEETSREKKDSLMENSPASCSKSSAAKMVAVTPEKKTAKAAQRSAKRKADKQLLVPVAGSVSTLRSSLKDAKDKREATKQLVKAESAQIRNAKKRLERVKSKAKVLSNNDLYEVYLLRMQEKEAKDAQQQNIPGQST
jgi:hypothetical protein